MSISRRFVFAFLLLVWVTPELRAQNQRPPQPQPARPRIDDTGVPDTSMFAPLNLPTGNLFRSGSGAPGPRYWQNKADYDLHGTLDTTGKSLKGEATIRH